MMCSDWKRSGRTVQVRSEGQSRVVNTPIRPSNRTQSGIMWSRYIDPTRYMITRLKNNQESLWA